MTKRATKQDKEHERIGKLLVNVAEMGATDKKRLYTMSFMKGVYGGLGGVIGATIVVGLILLILSLLGEVPFVGPVAETVEKTLENR